MKSEVESVVVGQSDAPGMTAVLQIVDETGEVLQLHMSEEAVLGLISALRRSLRSVGGNAADNGGLH